MVSPLVTTRALLLKTIPSLCLLDSEPVTSKGKIDHVPSHPIVELCRRQIKEQDDMEHNHKMIFELVLVFVYP